MQISAVPLRTATTMPTTTLAGVMATPPRATGFELRAGEPLPANAPRSPAGDLVRERGRDLLAIPGAVSLSWRGGQDTALVEVNFSDASGASTALALLERVIDGVELTVGIFGQDGPLPDLPAPRTGDLVRAVAAMPGVWDYRYAETPPWSDGHVTFRTISREVVERLDPLLRNQIPFGTMPDGRERRMHLHWRPGVPAS